MDKIKKREKTSNSAAWYRKADLDDNPSRLSEIIVILLCAMLVFSNIAFGAVETWALGFLSLFAALIVIFWIADAWLKKEFWFSFSKLQLPLLGLILIGLIQLLPLRSSNVSSDLLSISASSSLSLDPFLTQIAVVHLIIYFIFFAAALTFINIQNRLRKIVVAIVIFGALMAFFGILQRLAGVEGIYGLRPTPQAIPFSSYVNQHHFAAFLEMTIGLTLGLLFGKATNKDKRFLLVIAAVLMGIAIVLTSSRGGMLSLFGVLAFVITANLLKNQKDENKSSTENRQNFRRNFTLIAGGLTLVLGLFGAVILLGGDASLLRGVGLTTTQDLSSGRTHFWYVALQVFVNNPILGVGLDAFGTAFTRFDTWNGTFRVEQAHNDYLQILADAGILGFVCVASFIYLLFKNSLHAVGDALNRFRRNAAIGALAGCFGVLIHSFFDFPLRTPANALFFLVFAVLATNSISNPSLHRKRE